MTTTAHRAQVHRLGDALRALEEAIDDLGPFHASVASAVALADLRCEIAQMHHDLPPVDYDAVALGPVDWIPALTAGQGVQL